MAVLFSLGPDKPRIDTKWGIGGERGRRGWDTVLRIRSLRECRVEGFVPAEKGIFSRSVIPSSSSDSVKPYCAQYFFRKKIQLPYRTFFTNIFLGKCCHLLLFYYSEMKCKIFRKCSFFSGKILHVLQLSGILHHALLFDCYLGQTNFSDPISHQVEGISKERTSSPPPILFSRRPQLCPKKIFLLFGRTTA